MKTLVVYKSKTGYTKRYAEWIAEELEADILKASQVSVRKMMEYDAIIYGGALYAVGINGINLIKNNLDRLKGRKIAVFAVGASTYREDVAEDIARKNFTLEQLESIRIFYMRGGFEYSRLGLIDKLMMNLLKVKLKKKENKTPDEKGMLAAYDTPVDFVRKKNIKELIEYINSE